MPKVKYPGEIGKPSPNPNLLVAVFRLYANGKGDYGVNRAIQYAEDERHRELMLKLLDHYRIEVSSPDRWLSLAYVLACDNVPAFQFSDKRPGRPRKMMRLRDLTKKRRGRPQSLIREKLLEYIISRTVHTCEKHSFKGHGACKRALDKLLRDHAKKTKHSEVQAVAQLPKFQKLLSQAKRKFPEIAAKLPQ